MLAQLVSEQIKEGNISKMAAIDASKLKAKAMYDYDAVTDEELNFDQGDDFIILKFDDPEWFFARRVEPYEGEPLEGYIPKSFCQVFTL